jgi:hypothetical protein
MKKDKKQMLVLGALVLLVLAIGAFQFMGSKPKPVAAKHSASDKPKDDPLVASVDPEKDPMKDYIEQMIATSSTPRDPFAPQAVVIDEPEPQPVDPGTVAPHRTDPGSTMPRPEIGTGSTGGQVDPLYVDPQIVPDNGNNTAPTTNGQPFALTGVMIGKSKKLCMLLLRDGQQTLVREGQSFGPNMETTVVTITEEYVVLRHLGKEITLGLNGGN